MPVVAGAIILGAGAVGKTALGAIGGAKAKKARRKFESSNKLEYSTPQQLTSQAEGMVRYGFEPEEQASFQQEMARETSRQMRQTQGNPNLSQAIVSGINYGNVNKWIKFAEANARMKRQRLDEMYSRLERADTRQVNQNLNTLAQYGQAESDYRTLAYQGLNDLTGAGTALLYGGIGGTGTPPISPEKVEYMSSKGSSSVQVPNPYASSIPESINNRNQFQIPNNYPGIPETLKPR